MKALFVLVLVLLAAATAYAYGRPDVAGGLTTVVAQTGTVDVSEPAIMLLSGGLLLAAAGAVRRFSI